MACCLTAPSHYVNQHWLIIRLVLWHSSAQFQRKCFRYLFLVWFWIFIDWRLHRYFTGPMRYFARFDFKTGSFMMTSSNGNIFRVTGEFPAQRPVTRSFDVFFDPRLNNRLGKQSWGWWFETPSHPYDVIVMLPNCHIDTVTWGNQGTFDRIYYCVTLHSAPARIGHWRGIKTLANAWKWLEFCRWHFCCWLDHWEQI